MGIAVFAGMLRQPFRPVIDAFVFYVVVRRMALKREPR